MDHFNYSISWRSKNYSYGNHLSSKIGNDFEYSGSQNFNEHPDLSSIDIKNSITDPGHPCINNNGIEFSPLPLDLIKCISSLSPPIIPWFLSAVILSLKIFARLRIQFLDFFF